jgi:hypothetical protein
MVVGGVFDGCCGMSMVVVVGGVFDGCCGRSMLVLRQGVVRRRRNIMKIGRCVGIK